VGTLISSSARNTQAHAWAKTGSLRSPVHILRTAICTYMGWRWAWAPFAEAWGWCHGNSERHACIACCASKACAPWRYACRSLWENAGLV